MFSPKYAFRELTRWRCDRSDASW